MAIALTPLAGCTVGPNFVRPAPQVPAHWSPTAGQNHAPAEPAAGPVVSPQGSLVTEQAEVRAWWGQFNDPMLSSLIDRSVTSNLDLRAAVLRIEESRAQRDVTAAAWWPSASVDASYSRQRISETTPTGSLLTSAGSIRLPGGAGISIPNPYSQYQLSADASWEIDLFGRVRRSVEAADAGVQASVEDQHAVQLSLLGDVAQSYIALRGAQSRLRLANENLATIGELLELTRERRAAGLTTLIDVSNARAQQSATQPTCRPSNRRSLKTSINSVSSSPENPTRCAPSSRRQRRFRRRPPRCPSVCRPIWRGAGPISVKQRLICMPRRRRSAWP